VLEDPEKWDRVAAILTRRQPDLRDELEKRRGLPISSETSDEIIDALIDEFTEFGLMPDSEPNPYGLVVEDLIDFVNSMTTGLGQP
jgi:hypothetical protein